MSALYSFEHVRDANGEHVRCYDRMPTTAASARRHARHLAAKGWTFSVLRTVFAGHRWFRGHRRRTLRRNHEARWHGWMLPCVDTWLPESWWRARR